MMLSLSLPNVLLFSPHVNDDQRGLLEISQHMHTKEDCLEFTQEKCIKTAQSLAVGFAVVNTHVDELPLAHHHLIRLCLSQCHGMPGE